jgi:hypothetical protein
MPYSSLVMAIYVEIPIRASLDDLWEKTQNPDLHERWDLRFSQIEYLPQKPGEPQRFLYRTRIGFGLKIDGQGESIGSRNGDNGERTSSLKFWSKDPKSLIKIGSGYWKYVPDAGPIRFYTWYDYQVRFGVLGRLVDRCFFRPLLGWATAWSFDRLRLWLEKEIAPEVSRERAVTYALARGTTAFIWFYHGLVPKLLFHSHSELDLLSRIGTAPQYLHAAATLAGLVEMLFAALLVALWRQSWLLWTTLAVMIAGIPIVALTAPEYVTEAFNPVTLNVSLAAFAGIALLTKRDLPSATRCRRKPERAG